MAPKRKRSTVAAAPSPSVDNFVAPSVLRSRRTAIPLPSNISTPDVKPPRRQPSRGVNPATVNPDTNPDILDGVSALRASPDGHGGDLAPVDPVLKPRIGRNRKSGSKTGAGASNGTTAVEDATTENFPATNHAEHGRGELVNGNAVGGGSVQNTSGTHAPLSETTAVDLPGKRGGNKKKHVKVDNTSIAHPAALNNTTRPTANAIVKTEEDVGVTGDPEVDNDAKDDDVDEAEVKEASLRPPPVNSDYLPLPWKGRLGYACLNTYLRNANPPVFSSRTCRVASILEHRHPLKDPSQLEHPTKNRPDKEQPADVARGQRYVEELGLANARDVIKMVRWNDKYGIKFMRLSSEMFPFASHDVYGYKLAPFAADTLAEAGKVIAELGHRVTTHPGQFTQLGSPRKEVIENSIRDLEYHAEMLSLLKLPPQQDRDAVMILHLGGAYGDKPAAIARFRENYARLSGSVKKRLVLENDDVVWSLHEILPLCQELNIPCVLDFHHHNILFDSTQIREGTKDVVEVFPAIIETWDRKNITPKMHYSEPCPGAITGRDRRKHSPRVATLPPCPDTMDLMIEAKDKEQAVFELMRAFKLPGFDSFNDIVPHVRQDENKPFKPKAKKPTKKGKKQKMDGLDVLDGQIEAVKEEEHEPALVAEDDIGMGGPERRVYWPQGMEEWLRPPKRVVKKKDDEFATPVKKKRKTNAAPADDVQSVNGEVNGSTQASAKKTTPKRVAKAPKKKTTAPKIVPTPSPSDDEDDTPPLSDLGDDDIDDAIPSKPQPRSTRPAPSRKRSGRVGRVSYQEEDGDMSV
ncbi:UV-endonuclease UvdE-domain-containing protein [Dendryphion nanum]|uniref:UV-endonuclease UvdE-domain-containing protein n=1 Tax=Dendryphion nanum TaxID=256645 RepID=A0A9P9IK95_9PLEO|nr:UV-endonuclease UvdE-domain-containing protein [Dendryphion nanum]